MLETAITMMGGEVLRAIAANETPPLVGNASGKGGYVSDTYRCKEGYLSIAAGAPPRREKLWKALDATDIPRDPRFATDAAVAQNMRALNEEIERRLSSRTAGEWEAILNQAGVAAMEVIPLARRSTTRSSKTGSSSTGSTTPARPACRPSLCRPRPTACQRARQRSAPCRRAWGSTPTRCWPSMGFRRKR
jgi:crotonobetainyl-CoA:carnitine CoA-transferase CaiB-like acyl-CoA transferase